MTESYAFGLLFSDKIHLLFGFEITVPPQYPVINIGGDFFHVFQIHTSGAEGYTQFDLQTGGMESFQIFFYIVKDESDAS